MLLDERFRKKVKSRQGKINETSLNPFDLLLNWLDFFSSRTVSCYVAGNSSVSSWIGVDLDGTLAEYDKWLGETIIGKPVNLMVERVKKWLALGYEVRIMTARASYPTAIPVIQEWCEEHIGQVLPITNQKDKYMVQLWDDRAVTVCRNTGEILTCTNPEQCDQTDELFYPKVETYVTTSDSPSGT